MCFFEAREITLAASWKNKRFLHWHCLSFFNGYTKYSEKKRNYMSIGMFPLCKSQKYTNMYEFHERDLLPNCKVKKLAIGEHSNEETWTISHFLDWSLSFKDFVRCVMFSKQAIVGNILIPSVILILMKFSSCWWQIGGDIVYFCHIILGTLLLYGLLNV